MRYQTAPRPEGFSAAPRSRYVGSSYAEAGDRNRTGSATLEGSNATVNTSPASRAIIGSGCTPLNPGEQRPHCAGPLGRATAMAVCANNLALRDLLQQRLPAPIPDPPRDVE